MFKLLCVTNRTLCGEPFLQRIEKISKQHPAGIILREKDLSAEEYDALAKQAAEICKRNHTPCIFHSFTHIAIKHQAKAIHLPLPTLRAMTEGEKAHFQEIGASCHSVEEAQEAAFLGCTYITVGHIFATDCKKGLPGRGLHFLEQVVQRFSLPVYAIGGITPQNIGDIRETGAAGACIMSGLMRCDNVESYFQKLI